MTVMHDDSNPDAVRLDYLMSLSNLKDTSRPIIGVLTSIAKEASPHHAAAIVAAITYRSLHTQYQLKLPLVYLIDSILKNVGGIYRDLFAECIYLIYTNAFTDSDESTRLALLKVLGTWRWPPPQTVGPIFPAPVLDQIDGFVRSIPRPNSLHSPYSVPLQSFAGPDAGLKLAIVNDVTNLINARQFLQQSPNHSSPDINQANLDTLIQLRAILVSDQFRSDQLEVVKTTVAHLTREFLSQSLFDSNTPSLVSLRSVVVPELLPTVLPPLPSPPSSVLGMPNALLPVPFTSEAPDPQVNSSLEISLTSLHPEALSFIYPAHQTKCGQCGLRFSSVKTIGSSGTSELDAHMDLHFRRNRKARDPSSCLQSRVWLTPRQAWVTNAQLDEQPAAPAFFSGTATKPTQIEPIGSPQVLIVPRDQLGAPFSCAVCMERLSTGYNAELDEWVVKDEAVLVSDKYYHVSCANVPVTKRSADDLEDESPDPKRIHLA